MEISNKPTNILKRFYANLDAPHLREDQYEDSGNGILVEAKRLILKEQVDKIINVTLRNVYDNEKPFESNESRLCRREVTSHELELIGNVPAPHDCLKVTKSGSKKPARRGKLTKETQQILDKIESIKRKHEKLAENRKLMRRCFESWRLFASVVKKASETTKVCTKSKLIKSKQIVNKSELVDGLFETVGGSETTEVSIRSKRKHASEVSNPTEVLVRTKELGASEAVEIFDLREVSLGSQASESSNSTELSERSEGSDTFETKVSEASVRYKTKEVSDAFKIKDTEISATNTVSEVSSRVNKSDLTKLDDFFRKLNLKDTNKKVKNGSQSKTSKFEIKNERFENRYKAQKDIILMQKTKMLEQERLIQDLKHGKISVELDQSILESKQQLKEMMKQCSTKTKCKIGVPTVIDDDRMEVKPEKVPKIVRKMERRALERQKKRAIIQERKRLIDEERKIAAQEAIDNKRIQDEEEKRRNLEAIKERRKLELETEKRKQLARLTHIANCEKADAFYARKLKRHVMNCLYVLMEIAETDVVKSEAFYEISLRRKCFGGWRSVVACKRDEKYNRARNWCRRKMLRKGFQGFVVNYINAKRNKQVAVDYSDYKLQERVFKHLHIYVCKMRMEQYHLQIKAAKHYNYHILVQYFYQWKTLPAVLRLEKLKEAKKMKWREKVRQILPDYEPPTDVSNL